MKYSVRNSIAVLLLIFSVTYIFPKYTEKKVKNDTYEPGPKLEHPLPFERDEDYEKMAYQIYHNFTDKPVEIWVVFNYDIAEMGLNGVARKIGNHKYVIYLATHEKKILYHEVAHVLTFEEGKAGHCDTWKNYITEMGYPKEADRY